MSGHANYKYNNLRPGAFESKWIKHVLHAHLCFKGNIYGGRNA